MTPYLIITDEMTHALCLAAKRGVDVRIITPGIPDKKFIYNITPVSYTHLDVYKRQIRGRYDYILIDCMPSLGMMTINALVSSDSVLIPVQAAYLPVKGLQQLIKTILTVKKRLNRKLAIEGILLTMVDFRTNYARDIASRVHTTYGSQIEVFENVIPMSVKAAETSAEGKSIYMHCPKGKVAEAYMKLTQRCV